MEFGDTGIRITEISSAELREAFNVTDGGGEAFRVTDGGGEDFNVLKE